MARVLVIGVGNEFRRDDGVGPAVAARLEELSPAVDVAYSPDGEPADLVTLWEDASVVIVVDAVHGGQGPPGRVHRLTVDADVVLAPKATSSHGLGLGTAVEFARALDRLPERLVIYAVEGEDFGFGRELSPAVERAVEQLAESLVEELGPRT